MAYYQEPFLLNQGQQQFQDESYFTNFQSNSDDHDLAAKDLNAWSIPMAQQIPRSYGMQSYIDAPYLSPYLEPFEPTGVQTVGLAQLQLNGGSEFPRDCQPYQSPEEEFCALGLQNDESDVSPLSSPNLADTETYSPKKPLPGSRAAPHSSGSSQLKKGRPRKKRNQSSSSEDESAILKAKFAHSMIERRYRDNLNRKMMQLHRDLLAAETSPTSPASEFNTSPTGPTLSGRVRKSDIMSRAINYIHQSEVEIRHLDDEIKRLQDQVGIFQKLVNCDDCSLLKDMVQLGVQKQ
ncbi:Helix-loop-helix DNA-binding domain-containing protein [Cladophialophora immunda]|nr:Helix-loop-helix DNA-binding domain-containing protein [Cladophialophora immunda]